MAETSHIAANLASVLARMAAAAETAGREPAAVQLIAVSKTHGCAAIGAAMAAGQTVFGENRVQEAAGKFPVSGAIVRLIGPLQTNKVKEAVRLADFIDTLDREHLADAIERAADQLGRMPGLLVQINIGDEPRKAGVATAAAAKFIAAMQRRFGAALTGLMCIPPAGLDPAPFFIGLARLADEHGLAVRSMGMSGDFEAAIRHGATHVRIGSAIFGARAVDTHH